MTATAYQILTDKLIVPNDDLIFSIIGDNSKLWKRILKEVNTTYTDFAGEWRYYNDGKKWLFKMVQKKKTIFWASLLPGSFIITFYFGDKAEPVINGSDLTRKIKEEFITAKRYGAIRAISLQVISDEDADTILKLVSIKLKLK